jgi:hypothetical protein
VFGEGGVKRKDTWGPWAKGREGGGYPRVSDRPYGPLPYTVTDSLSL